MLGYLTTRVFDAPKMEWRMDFFVLAIARRTLMEIGAALIKKKLKKKCPKLNFEAGSLYRYAHAE